MLLRTLFCLFVVGTSMPTIVRADEGEAAVPQPDVVAVDGQAASADFPNIIEDTWRLTVAASDRYDLKTVNSLVHELERLKLQADISALDTYALFMVSRGAEALRVGDKESAAFYARKALQLSPRSPVVLARSLPLVRQTGTASASEQLGKILNALWYHPNVSLRLLKHMIYPALLAFSAGLLVALALTFAFKIETLYRGMGRLMPPTVRGLITPFVLLAVLVAPLFAGPLWTMLAWAICTYLFVPHHRWLGFAAGTLLALWGTVIPIRESLKVWLDHPGIQSMLNVASGVFSTSDRARLQQLTSERSSDGALYYTLGQVLRRHGAYGEADEAFLRAEMLLGKQPWTAAQRGVIAFLDGKLEKSEQLFRDAESAGLASAEFFFNYSKAKFEQMDTAASQKYLLRATQLDRGLTNVLKNREDLLGAQSRLAVAEMPLPFHLMFKSALQPISSIREGYSKIAGALMPGCSPAGMLGSGAALILFFFFARKRKSRTVPLSSYAHLLPARLLPKLLLLVPGGAWVRAGRPMWCFCIVSGCVFLGMPLVDWPAESRVVVDAFPEFIPFYLCAFALFALCACYIGAHLEEASENS